jgi:CO/xanthine dehydrogenase FAD-binding subunit
MREYFYPSSLEEAISILESHKNIRPIAGGTEINLKHRDVDLVDLRDLGLDYIYIESSGDVKIGATTTIAEIEESPEIEQYRALHEAAVHFTESVKHLATIGGNIAESVASSDMAPPLIALGARAVLVGREERTLPAHKMFRGLRRSSIREGEILKEFILPKESRNSENTASSFQRIGRTEEDLSITSVAVRLTMKEKKVKDVGIGVG